MEWPLWTWHLGISFKQPCLALLPSAEDCRQPKWAHVPTNIWHFYTINMPESQGLLRTLQIHVYMNMWVHIHVFIHLPHIRMIPHTYTHTMCNIHTTHTQTMNSQAHHVHENTCYTCTYYTQKMHTNTNITDAVLHEIILPRHTCSTWMFPANRHAVHTHIPHAHLNNVCTLTTHVHHAHTDHSHNTWVYCTHTDTHTYCYIHIWLQGLCRTIESSLTHLFPLSIHIYVNIMCSFLS